MSECKGKRTLDIIAVVLVSILCSPILLIVGTLVLILNGHPVLFTQDRSGIDGKIFTLYKFRTMTDQRDKHGRLLPDAERITCVGRFLRSFSLDELPQLFNVLKGEMSLVGPRPLLAGYLSLYSQEHARRHCLKPGVTGWAQVNGRNAISWEKKFELDIWYVDNWSLKLDIKILAVTLPRALKCSGVSAVGHATMPKFTGDKQESDYGRVA
jgi:lipopolysaccharide/colanic/teichoic acid biosynthesis glycosyltransferase